MGRFTIGTIAAALLLGAGALPAAAQEPSPQTVAEAEAEDASAPFAEMDEDQIIAFFNLISAIAEVEELVAPMIETMLGTGRDGAGLARQRGRYPRPSCRAPRRGGGKFAA